MNDTTALSDSFTSADRHKAFITQLVPVLIWLALCGLLFAPTLSSLFEKWLQFDESYGHGFLVLGISIWLIIRVLPVRAPLEEGFPPLAIVLKGLVTLVGLGAASLWTISWLTGVEFAQQIFLPAIVFSGLALLLGRKGPARMLLPVGLLYFAMPVWDYLNFPLQWITTKASEFLLWLLSIDAEIYGFFVKIPQGTFEIAGGCSGLRYLLVSLLLGVLYSHLYLDTRRQIAKLIGLAILVALVTNWIRVAAIIAIGHYTDMQSPLIYDHDNFGWYLFAGAMIPWFWYASRLETADDSTKAGNAAPPMKLHGASGLISIVLALAIAAIPGVTQLAHGLTVKRSSYADIELPYRLTAPPDKAGADYTRIAFRFSDTPRPEMHGFTQKFEGSYVENARASLAETARHQLTVDIFLYAREEHRAELIQYNNTLFDGRLWSMEESGSANRPGFRWLTLINRQSGERARVLYTYAIGGDYSSGGVRTKLAQLANLLLEGRRDSALVYLTTPCQLEDCSEASRVLDNTAEAQLNLIQEAIFTAYENSL